MQVPRLTTPEVQTTGIAAPRTQGLPAEAFGGGVGKALSGVSADVFQYAKLEQDKANAGMVLQSKTSHDGAEEGLVKEARGLTGQSALGMAPEFLSEWDKKTANIRQGLANDEQRAAFDQIAASRRHSFALQMESHEAEQSKAFYLGEATAAVKSSHNRMALYYSDPVRFDEVRQDMEKNVKTEMALKGFGVDSEATKERLALENSKAYTNLIEARMVDNAPAAKGYFDAVRPKLTAADAERIEKQLKPAVSFQLGLDTASRLIDENPGKTTNDLLNILRKDPSVTKDKDAFTFAEGQIKTLKAAEELARKDGIEKLEASVTAPLAKKIAAGQIPTLSDLQTDPNAQVLFKVDPEKYQKLAEHIIAVKYREEERHRAVTERSERKQEHEARQALLEEERRTRKTQRANYADLWSNPAALEKTDLNYLILSEDLTPEQAHSLDSRRNEGGKDTLLSEVQEVNSVLGGAKIKQETPQYDQAIEYINQRKAAFKQVEGREPKASEIKDFAREAVYKSNVGDFMGYDLNPFDKATYKMTIDDVPKADRKQITDALKRRGRSATDSDIISLYVRKQMKAKP